MDAFTAHTSINDHVLQTVRVCHSLAAQTLATQERQQAAVSYAARMHQMREAGIATPGLGDLIAAMRRLTGTALIWTGKRLSGQTASSAAPSTLPVR